VSFRNKSETKYAHTSSDHIVTSSS